MNAISPTDAATTLDHLKPVPGIAAANGGFLTPVQCAIRFGGSIAAWRRIIRENLVFHLDDDRLLAPACQFDDGGILEGLEEAYSLLASCTLRNRLVFLTTPDPSLDGAKPYEAMRRGKSVASSAAAWSPPVR